MELTAQPHFPPPREQEAGVSRRRFLAASGAVTLAGFAFCTLPAQGRAAASQAEPVLIRGYIRISPANETLIVCPAAEMGQGVMTSLPALIAEEMEADWQTVRVEHSPAGEVYANPGKNFQATGRSMSVRGYFDSLRAAGAEAKARLIAAAAEVWQAPREECVAKLSQIEHPPTGRRLRFFDLAQRAAALEPVPPLPLKSRQEWTLLGRSLPRKDLPDKVTGRAIFGMDAQLPGLLTATLAMAPSLGGALQSYDEAAALAVPGVRRLVPTQAGDYSGLAVVADGFWPAKKGLEAAAPAFSPGPMAGLDTAQLSAVLRGNLNKPGRIARRQGDLEAALAVAQTRVAGLYEAPYLAHATLEPMTCTAQVTESGCRIIAPTQGPMRARDAVAAFLGMAPAAVQVERVHLGGGFGRRWQPDFVLQAVEIARAVQAPVKLIWSREEDMRHDYYRPQAAFAFAAGLTAAGDLSALQLTTSCASIAEWGRPGRLQGRVESLAVSGLADQPYEAAHQQVAWVPARSPVPLGVWRSVGHSQNVFFLEGAMDEIASAAGADPLAFRKRLLSGQPRIARTLQAAAKLGDWRAQGKRGAGRGQGIAVAECYGSVCAYVVEVAVQDRKLSIEQISGAIDCGIAIHPDGVQAQMEGNIVFALTAALFGEVTVAEGVVTQSNFHDYRMASLAQIPPIRIAILEGGDRPGGAGEPGLPPFAPALVNAIFAATGERLRSLPLAKHGFSLA